MVGSGDAAERDRERRLISTARPVALGHRQGLAGATCSQPDDARWLRLELDRSHLGALRRIKHWQHVVHRCEAKRWLAGFPATLLQANVAVVHVAVGDEHAESVERRQAQRIFGADHRRVLQSVGGPDPGRRPLPEILVVDRTQRHQASAPDRSLAIEALGDQETPPFAVEQSRTRDRKALVGENLQRDGLAGQQIGPTRPGRVARGRHHRRELDHHVPQPPVCTTDHSGGLGLLAAR